MEILIITKDGPADKWVPKITNEVLELKKD